MKRLRAALVLGVLPTLAAAQTVVVRAADRATGAALGGALVTLESEAGKRLVRALADERGRSAVTAPGVGRYRIRVDAIGYQGIVSEVVALAAGVTLERAVQLDAAPLNLNELVVASSRPAQCSIDEAEGTVAARLWDEARKALTGTEITRSSRATNFEVRTFERRIDARGRVIGESSETRRGPSIRPFVAASADSLHRLGYVQARSDGIWFHAPDAELLLAEQFLDDHCFRPTAPDSNGTTRIGLEFEPTKDRQVSDVRGVLWLDARTLELRTMEFSYTGFELPNGTTGVGGRLEFLRLKTGGWIIGRWQIRMPVVGSRRLLAGRADSLMGYREAGGTAVATGLATAGAQKTAVTGVVFDSLLGRPLAGAVVSMEEGTRADTTDESGRFLIESPGTGEYLLTIDHPARRRRGLEPLHAAASLRRGVLDTTNIAFEGLGSTLRRLCGTDRLDPRLALLLVAVVDSGTGLPLSGVTLLVRASKIVLFGRATRNRVTVGVRGTEWEAAQTERGGAYVCGVPRDAPLEVEYRLPDRTRLTRQLEPDALAVRDVVIRHPD